MRWGGVSDLSRVGEVCRAWRGSVGQLRNVQAWIVGSGSVRVAVGRMVGCGLGGGRIVDVVWLDPDWEVGEVRRGAECRTGWDTERIVGNGLGSCGWASQEGLSGPG
jgi:hypothetical protein